MAAYRRAYDSRHLQADCQEPVSAPEPNAWQSSMGDLYLLPYAIQSAQNFCARYLRQWLGPSLLMLRYFLYFRFYKWRRICTKWAHVLQRCWWEQPASLMVQHVLADFHRVMVATATGEKLLTACRPVTNWTRCTTSSLFLCRKLHLFLGKSTKTAAARAALFHSNTHQIICRPNWGSLQLSRRPRAVFRGPTAKLRSWWRGTVVELRFLTDELSLSCAQPAADGWPLMWVNCPLQVRQLGQLSLSSFLGR